MIIHENAVAAHNGTQLIIANYDLKSQILQVQNGNFDKAFMFLQNKKK